MYISRRTWMSILLGSIVLMIPLAWLLLRSAPIDDLAGRAAWLRWVMLYWSVLLSLIVLLLLLTVVEIREVLNLYRRSRRQTWEETKQQLIEDYKRRQQALRRNGAKGDAQQRRL